MLLCHYIEYQYECEYLYEILLKCCFAVILNANVNTNVYAECCLNAALLPC